MVTWREYGTLPFVMRWACRADLERRERGKKIGQKAEKQLAAKQLVVAGCIESDGNFAGYVRELAYFTLDLTPAQIQEAFDAFDYEAEARRLREHPWPATDGAEGHIEQIRKANGK